MGTGVSGGGGGAEGEDAVMKPPMLEVHSSNVDRIGHDMATGELFVQWSGGKTSVYSGVPPNLAWDVMHSWSVGQALNQQVKQKFKHRYLDKDGE